MITISRVSDVFMARLQHQLGGEVRLDRFKDLVDKVCAKVRNQN